MKTCKCCGLQKPVSDYYKHPKMGDGFMSKCKECHKEHIRLVRSENIDRYREYDRQRGNLDHRVAARAAYAETDKGRAAIARAKSSYMARNPERRAANVALGNAVRDGVVVRQPCWVCGALKVEGHHPAYSMKLDVVWLCKPHHQQLHNEHDEYVQQQETI